MIDLKTAGSCLGPPPSSVYEPYANAVAARPNQATVPDGATFDNHLSASAPVSQPATPVANSARTVNVEVTYETFRLASSYYPGSTETKQLAPPFKVIASERDQRQCMPQPLPGDTRGLHEAIGAVQAVIEVASLSTSSVALYWRVEPGERPAPEEVREAAHWLEMLADALETDAVCKQRPH
ncbi:hypothetical protein [Bradyrhizobium sp. STM 3566]|uniref:hypothetical protein n=1 Tax=Bradyrhizobium sp. STM 3566 TaxID=578928 RepID=UPI003890939A